MNLSCKCGHTAPLDAFQLTRLGRMLERDHFQCPACNRAWRILREPAVWCTTTKRQIPGPTRVIEIPSEL